MVPVIRGYKSGYEYQKYYVNSTPERRQKYLGIQKNYDSKRKKMKKEFKNGVSEIKSGSYRVTFWNPISGMQKVIKTLKNYEEACEFYNEYQWDFYKEHKYLLPKGVSLHLSRSNKKTFCVSAKTINIDFKSKKITLGYFRNVQAAQGAIRLFLESFI